MATRGRSISFFTRDKVRFWDSVIFFFVIPYYAMPHMQIQVKSDQ
jgi:hypothetical protein